MNDFDYDCLQKKRIAQSAKKKKRPKKGCTLPSDRMTEAQKKKLNGEVKVMNLNKPMRYGYFKLLPKEMQEEYYNHLTDEFGVTQSDIARMLGCPVRTLANFINRKGLAIKKTNYKRTKRPDAWKVFCECGNQKEESAVPEDVTVASVEAEKPMEPPTSEQILTAKLGKCESSEDICEAVKEYKEAKEPAAKEDEPENSDEKVSSADTLREKTNGYSLHFFGVSKWEELFEMLRHMPLPENGCIDIRVQRNSRFSEEPSRDPRKVDYKKYYG